MQAFINDTQIFFEVSGYESHPPIVFIHGFPFESEMWATQTALLSNRFRTIRYDLRGLGQSDVGDGQYTIEKHVEDLFALLEYLKTGPVICVGLSMGGYILLRALEREPGRFKAAILCDTRSEADSNEAKIKRSQTMVSVKKNGTASFAESFIPGIFAPPSLTQKKEAVDLIRKMIDHQNPMGVSGNLLALAARTDTSTMLHKIKIPVLCLVGELDLVTPVAAMTSIHKAIPGSQMHIIPDAAHMSNLENPAEFNKHLEGFLEQFRIKL